MTFTIDGETVELSEETAPNYADFFEFFNPLTGNPRKRARAMLRTRLQAEDSPEDAINYVLERRANFE